jgi:hypothetical protein
MLPQRSFQLIHADMLFRHMSFDHFSIMHQQTKRRLAPETSATR